MSSVFLARQPIISINEELEAYEVMYLSSIIETGQHVRSVSATVVNFVLNKFGTQEFASTHKAFIKVDKTFLMSDLVFTIPNHIFTLCLFDDIELDEYVLERIGQLYVKGFSLGIHDTDLIDENILKFKKIIHHLHYFKVNISVDTGSREKEFIALLQKNGIKVVATQITDIKQYQIAKALKCDLYQGYWFSKPEVLEKKKFDPSQFNVLKLYNMLINDTNIDEITSEFEKNHALTLQLLQFVNSAHFHFKTRISSVHHILTLVGRQPLSQWLMFIIYSKSVSKDNQVPPLMLMVRNRTQLMQNLLKVLKPDVKSNALGEAYLVGVLSLIDTVFQASLEDILEHMHISDISKKALLYDEGTLGMLYKLVRAIEMFDISEITAFTKRYKLVEEDIQNVILESIEDVNSFEASLKEM